MITALDNLLIKNADQLSFQFHHESLRFIPIHSAPISIFTPADILLQYANEQAFIAKSL